MSNQNVKPMECCTVGISTGKEVSLSIKTCLGVIFLLDKSLTGGSHPPVSDSLQGKLIAFNMKKPSIAGLLRNSVSVATEVGRRSRKGAHLLDRQLR